MLYNNQIVDNTYQIIREIGSGGMGVVYLAYHLRLEKYIVMKKIKGQYSDMAFIRNEVDILKKLHHPYLPQVYDFIEYESELYTIIDYIDGYDLDYYISNNYCFTEGQLIKWLTQLCEVLEYLHSQKPPILHTDIKPANIIITAEGDVCLIDFGISLNFTYDVKGLSKNYSSPEQFYNVKNTISGYRDYCISIDERTDIYSLGATFYHIMTGVQPDPETGSTPLLSQYNLDYSEASVKIIEKAMAYNRDYRFKNAAHMNKTIRNIRKIDSRYKRYVMVQAVTSVLCGLMIVFGIVMLHYGNINSVSKNYETSYTEFLHQMEIGDYVSAKETGNSIINNSDFKRVIDNSQRAELLYGIGNCFYEIGDYYNAAEYNLKAIQICEDDEKKEHYYRDYCLALINNGDFDKANEVLQIMKQYYNQTESIVLIESLISYKQGDYLSAVNSIDTGLTAVKDSENKNLFLVLKGDSWRELKDYANAVTAYEQALQIEEDVSVLRKLGNTYLAYADEQSFNNASLINKAKNCFQIVYEKYYASIDDILNLAQTYRLSGDNSGCLNVLSEYINNNEVDDFRVYMHMAIAGSETGDANTRFYCEKAYLLYGNASDEMKNTFNNEDIAVMKELYKYYCNAVW